MAENNTPPAGGSMSESAIADLETRLTDEGAIPASPQDGGTPNEPEGGTTSPAGDVLDPFASPEPAPEPEPEGDEPGGDDGAELPPEPEPDPNTPVSQQFANQREKYRAREEILQQQITDLQAQLTEAQAAPASEPENSDELEELRAFRARFDLQTDPEFRAKYDDQIAQLTTQALEHGKAAGVSEKAVRMLMEASLEERYQYIGELQKQSADNPRIAPFLTQMAPAFAEVDRLQAARGQELEQVQANYQEYVAERTGTDREAQVRAAIQERYANDAAFEKVAIGLAAKPVEHGDTKLPAPAIFEAPEGKQALAAVRQRLNGEEITREQVVEALVLAEMFPIVYHKAAEYRTELARAGMTGPGFGGGSSGGGSEIDQQVADDAKAIRAHMGM